MDAMRDALIRIMLCLGAVLMLTLNMGASSDRLVGRSESSFHAAQAAAAISSTAQPGNAEGDTLPFCHTLQCQADAAIADRVSVLRLTTKPEFGFGRDVGAGPAIWETLDKPPN
jgi:hypothetical protein